MVKIELCRVTHLTTRKGVFNTCLCLTTLVPKTVAVGNRAPS